MLEFKPGVIGRPPASDWPGINSHIDGARPSIPGPPAHRGAALLLYLLGRQLWGDAPKEATCPSIEPSSAPWALERSSTWQPLFSDPIRPSIRRHAWRRKHPSKRSLTWSHSTRAGRSLTGL